MKAKGFISSISEERGRAGAKKTYSKRMHETCDAYLLLPLVHLTLTSRPHPTRPSYRPTFTHFLRQSVSFIRAYRRYTLNYRFPFLALLSICKVQNPGNTPAKICISISCLRSIEICTKSRSIYQATTQY